MRGFALTARLLGLAAPAWAQEPPAASAAEAPVDPNLFGVSLERIQRGLFLTESREKDQQAGTAFRLEYQVQVYGMAPKIEVLKGVDLFNGPVPGSAPSHRQFIEHVTPQIYRTPGLPLSAGLFWLANQFWESSKKSRCEEEIANYRALLMEGVNVAAPRCTQ
ncbi:MAG: hypothetical protein Q8L75_18090 [Acidobacteriota bacterium]|nr:hypothetical protein [Acidobacteriota bacterium]